MGGAFSFALPWLLAAGLALPFLWFLLRRLPPAVRRVRLPSIVLLDNAEIPPPPAATPPWWLVLLRIGIVALLIAGLAGPIWKQTPATAPPARLAIVIDNGWSAASQWDRLVTAASERIETLPDTTRFTVLPTAFDGPVPAAHWVDAPTAKAQLAALSPLPWPAERARRAAALPEDAAFLWVSDGVEDADAPALRRALAGAELLALPPTEPAIRAAGRTNEGWSGQIVAPPGLASASLRFRSRRGETLFSEPLVFDGDVATFRIRLDASERADVSRLTAGSSAQAIWLADGSAARPRVVVVEGPSNAPPLESGGYYVRRALEPHADVRAGTIADAADDPATLFVLTDVAAEPEQAKPLLDRVEKGAVVILFAGPRIAENGSALSPVPLRAGARALGGVLSWQQPQAIGGFEETGPLAGLAIPEEARISRQLLAASDNDAMRWAWLADGTPMVSAARRGAGLLILVHTAADPSWSTLPLSGLFEAMLRRLLPLGANPASIDIAGAKPWVLERMLGARGQWQEPERPVTIPASRIDAATASAATPPGLYRSGDARRIVNLAGALGPRFSFAPLATDGLRPAVEAAPPLDIGAWLIFAAVLLALVDILVALRLRGVLVPFGAALLVMLAPGAAHAADLQLAYVRTGSAATDAGVARGLESLGQTLTRRTSVSPGKPAAVDPARDPLGAYPVLYWPAATVRSMSPAAALRLRAYIAAGGLVLFDFGRPLGAGSGARDLLEPLGLPALSEVGSEHVLSRSFYLLSTHAGGAVWAEAGSEGEDSHVSGVVIGGGDWASLWSGDRVVSQAQREQALRFGVNLVMYALTGTYKADQVHTRALLDRMGGPQR
ncbi:DUF4159 domain-containing protein [Sphingosinicella soli]|uniref:DUF4159 domain-containing protein n=1 Tax=Sphingosinicella soli TaxID=333708 RepID=A0A7W7B197_9SPHN|nr:DUF4159 domain-containing protein [Sphingosinicella soli]MBB4631158.1 hypothetical protein [Sphingosinicella soli]